MLWPLTDPQMGGSISENCQASIVFSCVHCTCIYIYIHTYYRYMIILHYICLYYIIIIFIYTYIYIYIHITYTWSYYITFTYLYYNVIHTYTYIYSYTYTYLNMHATILQCNAAICRLVFSYYVMYICIYSGTADDCLFMAIAVSTIRI